MGTSYTSNILNSSLPMPWERIRPNKNEGIATIQKLLPTKKFKVQFEEDLRMVYPENMIKEKLIHQLMEEIKKEGYIKFTKSRFQGMDEYNMYTASITLTDQIHSESFVEENIFRVHGKDFNQDQIKEAILKTFPEEFL